MEDSVIKTMAQLALDYSSAIKSSENFAKILAKLDADLAKLQASALKGVKIPDLSDVTQFVQQMRLAVTAGTKLTDEEKKLVGVAQQYAYIQGQHAQKQQTITNAVAAESKMRQGLYTQESILAAERAAEERKIVEQAFLKIPATQAEIASLQSSLKSRGLESSELMKQANLLRNKIDLLEQERMVSGQVTVAAAQQTQEINRQIGVLKSQTATAIADLGPGKGGETFWERRIGWFVAGATFYGALRLVKEAFQNATAIESKMVVIRRVSTESTADFVTMQKELLDLGVQMGQTWGDISDIAVRWAQSGYNVRDTLELTRVSLLAMNTAELNAGEATTGLIAIMAQWGLQANQLLPVLDKINRTADSYALTSSDLIAGLSRSSGAARLLGMSLEETISLLTVMREGSGRTGKEVGNALNSILSFIQRPNTIKALMNEGIQVWADTSQTRMRNVMDILRDVSKVWGGMSDASKQALDDASLAVGGYTEEVDALANVTKTLTQAEQMQMGQMMAGTYRRNYLNVLLKDFAKTDEILLGMENALGYSLRENAMYLETYAAKVKQLKAAWEQASTGIAQSGVFDILKAIVDAGRGILWVFNQLPGPIRAATIALAAYGAVLAVVSVAQKFLTGTALANMLAQIPAVKTAWAFLTGLPPLVGIGVVAGGAALYALVKESIEYNRQMTVMADSYAKIQEKIRHFTQGTEEYNSRAQSRRIELIQDTEEYTAALNEEQQILNTIGSKFPELIVKMDQFGNVTEIASEKLERFLTKPPSVDVLKGRLQEVRFELALVMGQIAALESGAYLVPGELETDRPPEESQANADAVMIMLRRRALYLNQFEAETQKQVDKATGKTPDQIPFDAETWKQRLDDVMGLHSEYDLSLIEVQKNVRLTALEEERLRDAMADPAAVKAAGDARIQALEEENVLLGQINAANYEKLDLLEGLRKEAEASIAKSVDDKQLEAARQARDTALSQIKSLTSETASNTVTIRENEIAIESAGRSVSDYYKKIREEQKKTLEDLFAVSESVFKHEVAMGRANRDAQIAFYREQLAQCGDNAEKQMEIEENLQEVYRDALKEEVERVKQAYEDEQQALKDKLDADIKLRQDQIDAIEQVEKSSDREEATRQHGEKIKEIEKKLAYERLRTGVDHEKNKVELQKDITEENIRWQKQQAEWSRDDKKEQLEKEIDDLKESYDQRQKELEASWKKAEEFLNGEFLTVISGAAIYDPKWYQKGLDWATQLIQGFAAANPATAIDQIMAGVKTGVTGAKPAADVLARSRELAQAKKEWQQAYESGDTEGMQRAAAMGEAIRQLGPTLDPKNELTYDELMEKIRQSTAHTGARIQAGGFALLQKDEVVLQAQLAQPVMDLLSFLRNNPSPSTGTSITIGTLAKFENVSIRDQNDINLIAEAIGKRLEVIANSQGRPIPVRSW